MALEIPKEDAGAITTLQALPSATLDALIAALAEAPLISNPKNMAEYLTKQIPSIPADRLTPMMETLYTMYQIRELSGVKPSRFKADLMEAIEKHPQFQAGPKEMTKISPMLDRLLNIETLNTIAKAARLLRDGERLYCSGKILSDIRPVFGQDPAARPNGAVITHTLKIGYHEGSGHVEFHVVLDSADLLALAEVVKRAEIKDQTLRDLLKSANLPDLDD